MEADLLDPMCWLLVVGRPHPVALRWAEGCRAPQLHLLPQAADQELWEHCWPSPWPERLQRRVHWLAAVPGDAAWYRYNDCRFDGSRALAELQPAPPNLQLMAMELRPQLPLAAAVAGWQPAEVDGGALLMHGGDLLACLQGAGELLERVRLLLWWPDRCGELPAAAVEPLLMEAGLRPEALETGEAPWIWRRDEELVAQRRLRHECDQLRRDRTALIAERDGLQAERGALIAERDALLQRCEGQGQRLERINQELDAILELLDGVPEASFTPPLLQQGEG